MIRGKVSRQVVAALQGGPKTLGELAAIVYGSDNPSNREAATRAIARLRRKGRAIDSEWQYSCRERA